MPPCQKIKGAQSTLRVEFRFVVTLRLFYIVVTSLLSFRKIKLGKKCIQNE